MHYIKRKYALFHMSIIKIKYLQNIKTNLKQEIKHIYEYLKLIVCINQQKEHSVNIHQYYHKSFLIYLRRYFIFCTFLQIFSMSGNVQPESVIINEDFYLFSYDTYIENLQKNKFAFTNKNLESIYESPSHYLTKCQFIKDFLNLILDDENRKNFIEFIEFKRDVLIIIDKRKKLLGQATANDSQKCKTYIENLIDSINITQNLIGKRKDNFPNLYKTLKKLEKLVNINYDEFMKDKEYFDVSFYDYFCGQNFFQNEFNQNNADLLFEFFYYLDFIDVTHAFHILTHVFMPLKIIETDSEYVDECLNFENFIPVYNVKNILKKTYRFFEIYCIQDFINDINMYKLQDNTTIENICLNNEHLKKIAHISISSAINIKLQLYQTILIFLILIIKYKAGEYDDWIFFRHINIDSPCNFDSKLYKAYLELDIKKLIFINFDLNIKFSSNVDNKDFHKYIENIQRYKIYNITDIKFFYLLFLLSDIIDLTFKENAKAMNSFELTNYLLKITTNLLTNHISNDNYRSEIKKKYENYIYFINDWINMIYNTNNMVVVNNTEQNFSYTGIFYYENCNGLCFKYQKYDFIEFKKLLKSFKDAKTRKNCLYVFKLIFSFYFRFYFTKITENIVFNNLNAFYEQIKIEYRKFKLEISLL